MSEEHDHHPGHHFIGLVAAALSAGLLVVVWRHGLHYLNRTPFEELRYLVFAIVAVGLLCGLQRILSRFMH